MRDICRVYAANGEKTFLEMDLPATDYEMLDMMERLRLKEGELPYLEVLKFCEEYDYLERCVHEQPDIYQLNALAKKLSEFTSVQDMAAFGGQRAVREDAEIRGAFRLRGLRGGDAAVERVRHDGG